MVVPSHLWSFAALAVAIVVVPGPSVLFVISRSVAYGRRVGLLTVLGNAAGAGLQAAAVAAGLGVVIERSIVAFTVLKLAGAAYLVWLGVRAWRERRELSGLVATVAEPRPPRRILLDGFMVGITNPKLVVFFAAVLPQFVDRQAGSVGVQMTVLGLVFVGIALLCDSTWALAAGSARGWLARSPRRLSAVGGAGGLVTIGLGLRLAFLGRHD